MNSGIKLKLTIPDTATTKKINIRSELYKELTMVRSDNASSLASSGHPSSSLKKAKAVVIKPQRPFIRRKMKTKAKNLTPFNLGGKHFRSVVKNMISPKSK